ncbi:heterogeneous nuclear ribonucleoprotein R-like isoform X2 [Ananas comosus]|uniref:Heterogeneous nuclear ribonucleoprotein R-like isoform X2 n=1 Tax=Ananas comosus TaxID=4615 RepID=A0A6P5FIV1_ANACO|nr:heterogeneous nuclear ribonucleoprotein R-like isoform X2 [Ananas comosus]
MAPKKRVVRTVRKTPASKSKSKPQPQSPSPPPPAAVETPVSAAAEPVPAPPPQAAAVETAVSAAAEPSPAPAPPPEPSEREAPEKAAKEADASEAPPPVAAEPAQDAAAGKRSAKKVVRKVIKKKIVKKLVPKASLAAKSAAEAPKPADLPAPDAADEALAEKPEPENPNPDAAPQQPENEEEAPEDQGKEEMEEAQGNDAEEAAEGAGDEEAGITERQKRRKTEIFIGGLDRDAKEEDIRKVFGKAGEIMEVRMMMDAKTGKNKGFCFLRYKEPAQAKKAVTELSKVEICGKLCGAATLEENDTIFLGNIDKKWKKEDVLKLLQEIGIEKIDSVTVMADPNNPESNRGFAFLELETNRDAQLAFKKLQKKDVFGKGRNIKVAWTEPLNDPDDEVKSVYVEGIPSSWDQAKLRELFKKFGEIERVVLSRDMHSAKRKDFAFVNYATREAALSCIESFEKEELTDNESKVNIKVSLAKPIRKDKQNKGWPKSSTNDREKSKTFQHDTKPIVSSSKGMSSKGDQRFSGRKSSPTHELLHGLREQAAWKPGQVGYGRDHAMQDYGHALPGGKRPFSTLGDDSFYPDTRGYSRPRFESNYPVANSSYGAMPHSVGGSSHPYYNSQGGYGLGGYYGAPERPSNYQMRQGPPPPPFGSRPYPRY